MCIRCYNSFYSDTVTIVNTSNTHLQDEDYFINKNVTDADDDNLNYVVQSDNYNTDDESLNYTGSVSINGPINNNYLENIMEILFATLIRI